MTIPHKQYGLADVQSSGPSHGSAAAGEAALAEGPPASEQRLLDDLLRRDPLLQALSRGINAVLTADVIKQALPHVLESIGKVTSIDRMLVVEGFHGSELKPRQYYTWRRSGVAARVNLYQAATDPSGRRAV